MTRTLFLLPLLAATASAAATASGAPSLRPAFINTIVSSYPDGRTAYLWLDRGGGYRATGRRGQRSDGHWSLKGDKVCLKQSHPMAIPFHYCTAVPAGGAGTKWTAKDIGGQTLNLQMVAGRVKR